MKNMLKVMLLLLVNALIASPIDSSKIADVVVRRPELTFLGAVVATSSVFGAYKMYTNSAKLKEINTLQLEIERYWRIAYPWMASLERLSNKAKELESRYGLPRPKLPTAKELGASEHDRMRAYYQELDRFKEVLDAHKDLKELEAVILGQELGLRKLEYENGMRITRLLNLQQEMGLPLYFHSSPNPQDFVENVSSTK